MPAKGGHLKKRMSSTKVVPGLQQLKQIFITNNLNHVYPRLSLPTAMSRHAPYSVVYLCFPGLGTCWRAPNLPVWLQFWISSQWEPRGVEMLSISKSFLPLRRQDMAMELSQRLCYRPKSGSHNRDCLHVPCSNARVENTPKAEASV